MKKLIVLILLSCGLFYLASAQTDKNRTTATKIADLLAKTPADDSAQLWKNASAVADLGEAGLVELARQLDKSGDPTRINDAIGGFSFCATRSGNEAWRSLATNSYGKALSAISNPEAQLFLITQLEQVGKDDAVVALVPFLTHERLSDAAARALATINTESSKQSLLIALGASGGNARVNIVQALGYTAYQPAAKSILPLAGAGDQVLRKVSLHSLAQIGDASAEPALAAAAAKAGYTYDNTEATAAYLLLLNNLSRKGSAALAGKKATALTQLKKPEQVHTRIAALKILTDIQGDKSTALLTGAMKDADPEYRQAALKFAAPYVNGQTNTAWLSTLQKSNNTVKAEIINMLAGKGDAAAFAPALALLKGSDVTARMAVANAAAITGKSAAVAPLISLLNKAGKEEATAVKKALLLLDGKTVTAPAAAALAGASSSGKAALLDVLGEKGAGAEVATALPYLNSPEADVKASAAGALNKMAGPQDLAVLFPLLSSATDATDLKNAQGIVTSALNGIADPAQRSTTLLNQFAATPAGKKANFYPVFSGVGGKAGLQTMVKEFGSSDEAGKKAAIDALAGWKEGEAASELARLISENKTSASAPQLIDGFTKQIARAKKTPEQRYILIRDVMEATTNKTQQAKLLNELSDAPTYGALKYAGQFLQDPQLKYPAASTVKDIAISNPGIYGAEALKVMQEAVGAQAGAEADYQKEELRKHIAALPKSEGFKPLFNEKDLSGWKGLVADPIQRAKMDAATLAKEQAKADEIMRKGWSVENGVLVFGGHGENLCTDKKYGDFEMIVDWKIEKDGDAGIYLRGTPQVQIWDTSRRDVGAEVGSGGLYNNQKNPSKPLVLADNAIGDWNNFRIIMVGDQVTVYLNGVLVVDKVALENFWDRGLPLFTEEQIELQAHGNIIKYRDIYIREIPSVKPFVLPEQEVKDNFKMLFDGTSLHEWVGNKTAYVIEDGNIAVYPKRGGNGNLYTKDEYSDFIYRFEFKLTPGANNGVGIRAPLDGDAAYDGMEIQILDNDADIYKNLQVYQYHGSVYGVIPAKRGYLKPVGEWNEEEIAIQGSKIKVTLNGTVITEGDIAEASKNGTVDHREHPGLARTKGHIGFLGHGDTLFFRNIRVKDLSVQPVAPETGKKKKKGKK
ncbi:DUF1080 domain-containing protein [Flavihumibacter fluvii]|uniref:DUF1080 domain-containing protein n=1 Tax=Flavihumibacter fluvii TaxID=2838157 RepID=UPI001BDF6C80|nr:DUF1080 domain-containing protein [Flavihumibacter fluvii]ULQ51917.1 DUF1080 domain-containing protein [Flavihumibacter fluvii]